MRVVVALGGNALLERGEKPDAAIQRGHVQRAAQALAPVARDHELLICHGNGPQVGVLAIESEADHMLTRPYPLDLLGAQTQGMIGYWLAQELRNAGVARPIVAIITQTVVASNDPAFSSPTKFIGPVYSNSRAHRLADDNGWTVAADGDSWRRVVASPTPVRIIEQASVDKLLAAGAVVICGGGGGVPVLEAKDTLTGVQAVVDKDLTAAMLAVAVGADRLLVLTDVQAVMSDFGTPKQAPLRHLTIDQLDRMAFPPGSMRPKIAACRQYVSITGHPAGIGALADAGDVLAGRKGTTIDRGQSLGARPDRGAEHHRSRSPADTASR
jgi:carbamate kinase